MKILATTTVILMFTVSIGGLFLVKYLEKIYGYGWLFKIAWLVLLVLLLFFVFRVLGPWAEKKFGK